MEEGFPSTPDHAVLSGHRADALLDDSGNLLELDNDVVALLQFTPVAIGPWRELGDPMIGQGQHARLLVGQVNATILGFLFDGAKGAERGGQ